MIDRRSILTGAGVASVTLAATVSAAPKPHSPGIRPGISPAFTPRTGPRARVMVVNDLCGDIDGLFATVHALLSPSTRICGIVGTAAMLPNETAQKSVDKANEILRLIGLEGKVPVHAGAARKLGDDNVPVDCPGARAIVDEAMRDSPLPLYVTVGGGLTEVASALLLEPRIADRLHLVWIGGDPHDKGSAEYNFTLDRRAAQFIFNDSPVPLWQVTSEGYGSCLVSDTELQAHVAPYGAIGAWLYARIVEGYPQFENMGMNLGETWALGDSPLVLLTALTGGFLSGRGRSFKYERTSSPFEEVFVPRLKEDGSYEPRSEGRRMRVFNRVDSRLMLGDFFAKMKMNFG